MSAPRRRRWFDVIRRTAGAAASSVPTAGLDDADLWASRDEASKASGDGFRAAGSLLRPRALEARVEGDHAQALEDLLHASTSGA